MKKQNKRLQMEQLEDRQLMAGNVLAFMSSGNLHVVEAAGQIGRGQAVQVAQLSNGNIRVQGLSSQDGGTSLINGGTFRDFTVPGNLNVNLGAGRDNVVLGRSAPSTFNNVYINTGVAAATAIDDRDFVNVERVTTRGHLTVDTGASSDYVSVFNNRVGDTSGIDNLTLRTGTAADYINVNNVNVNGNLSVSTYNTDSESDADHVHLEMAFARSNLQVFTGGGDDYLTVVNGFAGNDAFFTTGAGNDTVRLTEVQAVDDFMTYLEAGDDTLDMQYLRADVLTLDGGVGTDRLTKSVEGEVNQLLESNWERPTFTWFVDAFLFTTSSTMTLQRAT